VVVVVVMVVVAYDFAIGLLVDESQSLLQDVDAFQVALNRIIFTCKLCQVQVCDCACFGIDLNDSFQNL
jgi:hypothetical protein